MTNNNNGQKTEIGGHLGSGQGEGILFVGMGREHVLERKRSALEKRGLEKHLTGESRQKPFPQETQGSLAKGQDNGVAHEPQLGLGGGTDGQQDDLTCRANALCRMWHLHKALGRRGGGLLPHFRKSLNREGSRAFVAEARWGRGADQGEGLLMHASDSLPFWPEKGPPQSASSFPSHQIFCLSRFPRGKGERVEILILSSPKSSKS